MRTAEFDGRHVAEASRLLAVRLGVDPQAEMSALPVSEEICAGYIGESLDSGAEGVAVMDLQGMAGYLLASEGDNDRGRHVWTARECHAYRDDPEVLRAAYAALANRWVATAGIITTRSCRLRTQGR